MDTPPDPLMRHPQASLHAHTTSEEGHQCRVAAQQEGDLAETRMSAQHVGLSEELGQGWCLSARSVLWEVGSLGLSRAEALQASLLSPCGVAESGGRARMCQDRAWPHSSPGGHGPGRQEAAGGETVVIAEAGCRGWAVAVLPRRADARGRGCRLDARCPHWAPPWGRRRHILLKLSGQGGRARGPWAPDTSACLGLAPAAHS